MAAPKAPKAPDIEHPELPDTDGFRRHMPAYSSMCPVCGPAIKAKAAERQATAMREARVAALQRSLVLFGYSTLTLDETAKAYDAAMRGEAASSADIIVKMVASQLRDAGLLPDV